MMGLAVEDAAYTTKYGESFPRPSCLGIYASDIDTRKEASLEIWKKEAFHKARIADREIYNLDKSKANRFMVRVVANVWIYPLSKGSPTFYAKRKTKKLLDQLQVVCAWHHIIDLLALQE